ncbi:MAG: LEA type 2 family protein [Thermodesulfobacteriota bacterium]|nr:LEA type 2 family protein [Thermodesulfobacteriota bacterium]
MNKIEPPYGGSIKLLVCYPTTGPQFPLHNESKVGVIFKKALVIVLFVSLTSCGLNKFTLFKKPETRLSGVNLELTSLKEISLNITLSIKNPNPFTITFTGIKYAVYLNGQLIDNIELKKSTTIPGKLSTEMTIPHYIRDVDLEKIFSSIILSQKVDYIIKGSFGIRTIVGSLRIPFKQKGNFKIGSM